MNEKIYVACHAPCLSLLLFETMCSKSNQVGLLLGSVMKQIVVSKTDDNEADEQEKTIIYIEHCIPLPHNDFRGSFGNVTPNFLEKYADTYQNKLVGWYSFRRNSVSTKHTLREMVTHQSLLEGLGADPATFIYAMISANVQTNNSTHAFSQTFYRFNSRPFEPLRLKIYSVSDKLSNAGGYIVGSTFPKSETFESIVSKAEEERTSQDNVECVNFIHKTANECLLKAAQQIMESEDRRVELQAQVDELRSRVGKKVPIFAKKTREARKPSLVPHYIKYDPNTDYSLGQPTKVIAGFDDSEKDSSSEEDVKPVENHQNRSSGDPPSRPPNMSSGPPPNMSYASALSKDTESSNSTSERRTSAVNNDSNSTIRVKTVTDQNMEQ